MFAYGRGYTPDLAGWFTKFGPVARLYDANGHYARIIPCSRPQLNLVGHAGVDGAPQRLERYAKGNLGRCPGGAMQAPSRQLRAAGLQGLRRLRDPTRAHEEARIVALGVAVLPWVVIGIVIVAGDDDTSGGYYVRAIFDNASTLVTGEDVKVAGAPGRRDRGDGGRRRAAARQ